MSANKNAPIIIKRKKIIAGGGHHGGAWKVAYADFVTAMMAFFMLMWLLNATTETQRKGLADYFSPSIPVMRISGGGDGTFGGDNILTDSTLAQSGTGSISDKAPEVDPGDQNPEFVMRGKDEDRKTFEKIKKSLSALSGESMISSGAQRHILTRVTDEGLIVEIFDLENEPLFEENSARPTQILSELADAIVSVFKIVENQVAVNGHTQSHPIVLMENPVWDISSSRADRVRKMMQTSGLSADRVQRVSGFADRKTIAGNPMAARNNRIEMILLRTKK